MGDGPSGFARGPDSVVELGLLELLPESKCKIPTGDRDFARDPDCTLEMDLLGLMPDFCLTSA